jgi:hypothetical protein
VKLLGVGSADSPTQKDEPHPLDVRASILYNALSQSMPYAHMLYINPYKQISNFMKKIKIKKGIQQWKRMT